MWSEGKIVSDIERVALSLKKLQGQAFSETEYRRAGGEVSHYFLFLDGRSWKYYCEKAGYRVDTRNEFIPDDEYYKRLCHAVEILGRLPGTSERKKFGLNFTKSRWGTPNVFFEDAVAKGIIPSDLLKKRNSQSDETASDPKPVEPTSSADSISIATPTHDALRKRPVPPVPQGTRRKSWERTSVEGFPYAPHDESGTVALFAILCADAVIPWQILSLNGGKGIDGVCYDDRTGNELRIELKFKLSKGGWNHSFDSFDYLVCWENRWKDFPKPVIELREVLRR